MKKLIVGAALLLASCRNPKQPMCEVVTDKDTQIKCVVCLKGESVDCDFPAKGLDGGVK